VSYLAIAWAYQPLMPQVELGQLVIKEFDIISFLKTINIYLLN